MFHEFKFGHYTAEMACNINSGCKLSLNNEELRTIIKTHPETNTFWVLGTKLRVAHTIVGKHLAQIDKENAELCIPRFNR